jgi:hypothetical protein
VASVWITSFQHCRTEMQSVQRASRAGHGHPQAAARGVYGEQRMRYWLVG